MRELEVEELKRLRRRVKQLPPGFSQDPPLEEGPTTYCGNYTPPAVEQRVVRRNFTKGAGLTAEVLGISLRQLASARDAELALGGVG